MSLRTAAAAPAYHVGTAQQRIASEVRFTDLTDEELEALANQEQGGNPALTVWIHSLTDEELDAIIYDLPRKPTLPAGIVLE